MSQHQSSYRRTASASPSVAIANPLPVQSQIDMIPLIKSPSFRVQPPVELPPDIHPLPADISAYFVYPHTLETHALSTLPSALTALQASHSARLHLLASYAESKERARKARLNQLAPGWGESSGGVLQPVRRESVLMGPEQVPPRQAVNPPKTTSVLEEEEDDDDEEDGRAAGLMTSPRRDVGRNPPLPVQMDSPQEMSLGGSFDSNEQAQLEALVAGLAAMDSDKTAQGKVGDLF